MWWLWNEIIIFLLPFYFFARGGHAPPHGPGRGRACVRAKIPRVCGSFLKKQGVPSHTLKHHKISRLAPVLPSLLPPERGKLNTNARLNIRPKNENRAQLGGEMLRNISNNIINMYYKNTTRGQVKGTTWGPCAPPRDCPSGGARGGARARKNTEGWRVI